MKILFLTKSKEYTLLFLKKMHEEGHIITVVCKDYDSFSNTAMEVFCKENRIKYYDNDSLYRALEEKKLPKYDVAISNTFGRLIRKELIDWLKGMVINLHGAILPTYKGAFTYNWGLFNLEREWGVTAHYVNERFDEGDIIQIDSFSIDPVQISVFELERKTQKAAFVLANSIIERIIAGEKLDSHPQKGNGKYYSRKAFEELKKIDISDEPEVIERKIHACWCPPYEGAYIEIGNIKYYLINREIIGSIKNEQ